VTNDKRKKAIRERMAATGENYTTAMRAIERERLQVLTAEQFLAELHGKFVLAAGQDKELLAMARNHGWVR
jgi:hypothetical protein